MASKIELNQHEWNVVLVGAIHDADVGLVRLAIQHGADAWNKAFLAAASMGCITTMSDIVSRGASSWDDAQSCAARGGYVDALAWLENQPACTIDWSRIFISACEGGQCVIAQRAALLSELSPLTLRKGFMEALFSGDESTIHLVYDLSMGQSKPVQQHVDCYVMYKLLRELTPSTSTCSIIRLLIEIGCKVDIGLIWIPAIQHGRDMLQVFYDHGYICDEQVRWRDASIDTLVFLLEHTQPGWISQEVADQLILHPQHHALELFDRGHLRTSQLPPYCKLIYLIQQRRATQLHTHACLLADTRLPLVLCDLIVAYG
jgi:hypothetical protein